MKFFFVIVFFSVTKTSFANSAFYKGYFIDTNSIRMECFIKNKSWQNKKFVFEYKLSLGSESVVVAPLNSLVELCITEEKHRCKYIRYFGNFDKSGTDVEPSRNKEPEWIKKDMFLKVLVEGKASLFFYEVDGVSRFYYKVDTSQIEPLICKQYIQMKGEIKEDKTISLSSTQERDLLMRSYALITNNDFKKQIWNSINYEEKSSEEVERLEYKPYSLIEYFKKVNTYLK